MVPKLGLKYLKIAFLGAQLWIHLGQVKIISERLKIANPTQILVSQSFGKSYALNP